MKIFNVLPVSVYRNSEFGDTTNGGLSSKKSRLYVVEELSRNNVGGPFESDTSEVLVIVRDVCSGKPRVRAIPYDLYHSHPDKWVMFGGNFIYSSDSRFPEDNPIKVFDRVEN